MSTTMVYKHPGKRKFHGDMFDYLVVPTADLEKALAEGWSLTTTEAKEASKPKPAPAPKPKPAHAAKPKGPIKFKASAE